MERDSSLLVRFPVFTTTSQPARRRWGSFLASFSSALLWIEGLRFLIARTVRAVFWSAVGVASSAKTMTNAASRVFARSNTLVSAGLPWTKVTFACSMGLVSIRSSIMVMGQLRNLRLNRSSSMASLALGFHPQTRMCLFETTWDIPVTTLRHSSYARRATVPTSDASRIGPPIIVTDAMARPGAVIGTLSP